MTMEKTQKNLEYQRINKNILKKYDSKSMHKAYDMWPQLAAYAYDCDDSFELDLKGIDHVIFAGMGGSAAAGEIIRGILSKTDIHTSVVKGYLLPKTIDENTLLVVTSVSGNSEEPLSILEQSKRTQANVVAISSGGKMQEYCKRNNITHKKIEQVNSPRASLPLVLYSTLALFGENFGIKSTDIKESIKCLKQTSKKINSENLTEDNPSLSLAHWISQIPVIYHPAGFYPAALRFKNSLQENAKCNAITEDIIEACHNNIVTWEKISPVQPILLSGVDDHFKTKQRRSILKQYFGDNQIQFWEVESEKGSILTKLINLIYLLDYSTIYNSVINNIDPTPIHSIDYIKSKL